MRFSVVHHDKVIGFSELENTDRSMGIAFGAFIKTEHYAAIKHVFQLFAENKFDDYYLQRDALHLLIKKDNTETIPTNCVHI